MALIVLEKVNREKDDSPVDCRPQLKTEPAFFVWDPDAEILGHEKDEVGNTLSEELRARAERMVLDNEA